MELLYRANLGAPLRPASEKLGEFISVRDFGAGCDGDVDDTEAVQTAIDFCAANKWPTLILDGMCRLTSPVNINRPAVSFAEATAPFTIRGIGPNAGFKSNTAICLFDSTLPGTTEPVSQYIDFECIAFEVPDGSVNAYVLSEKFLRINFRSCLFNRIKLLDASIYAQQISILGGVAQFWTGTFFKTVTSGYDIVARDFDMEQGGSGFDISSAQSVLLTGVCFEGCVGQFWRSDSTRGLAIEGCYFEKNAGRNFTFAEPVNGLVAKGVALVGNHIDLTDANRTDPDFYDVVWGQTDGCVSLGNVCDGGMHDDNQSATGTLRVADSVAGRLNRSGRPISIRPNGVEPVAVITAHAGGGKANATVMVHGVNFIEVCAAAADSVLLPQAFRGMSVTVMNKGANNAQVFGATPDTINGVGTTTGVSLAPDSTLNLIAVVDGQWFSR